MYNLIHIYEKDQNFRQINLDKIKKKIDYSNIKLIKYHQQKKEEFKKNLTQEKNNGKESSEKT